MSFLAPPAIGYAALLGALLAQPLLGQSQAARDAILGEWHGASTCTKAAWNAACHDEQNVYVFARMASPDSVAEQAYKLVGGTLDLMGEQTMAFDPRTEEWFADFSNTRVSIRVSYHVADSLLTGKIVDLRTARIVRQVVARRATTSKLPPN